MKELAIAWNKINEARAMHLKQTLLRMKKTKLDVIRKRYALKNISHLNKADLVDRLAVLLPVLYPLMLERIGQTQYELLCTLTSGAKPEHPIVIDSDSVDVLEQYCLAFSAENNEESFLYVPMELADAFRKADTVERRQAIHQNTEWVALTQGMLHFYGALEMWQLKIKMDELTGEYVPFDELYLVLEFACAYHRKMARSSNAFHDIRVLDVKEVLREHKRRENILLYPFDRKQLLAAALPEYVEKTPAMQRFIMFISNHFRFSEEEVDDFIKNLYDAIQAGDRVPVLMNILQEWIQFPSEAFVNELMSRLMPFYNASRQWALKGYAPDELIKEERKDLNLLPATAMERTAAEGKVGRNEPCPCGSGKKYKRCCMPARGN